MDCAKQRLASKGTIKKVKGVSEKEDFIQHCFFIPMFSKERASRGLIGYQLKITGKAMRITMYNFFHSFFFFATNVHSENVHSVKVRLLLYFPNREHLLPQYWITENPQSHVVLITFFLSFSNCC